MSNRYSNKSLNIALNYRSVKNESGLDWFCPVKQKDKKLMYLIRVPK